MQQTTPRKLSQRQLWFGAPLLFSMAGTACSASSQDTSDGQQGKSAAPAHGEVVGVTSQPLTDSDICDVINAGTQVIAKGVPGLSADIACKTDSVTSTSYFGSSDPENFDSSRARTEAQAVYCALQAADGHNAVAQWDTPLGKMGMQSRVVITNADPGSLHVTGQRIGTLVAFGQYMDLESQTFDLTSPTEYQVAQSVLAVHPPTADDRFPRIYEQDIPENVGQYSVLNVSGTRYYFNVSGSTGTVPIELRAHATLTAQTPYDSGNHSAFAMNTPAAGPDHFPTLYQLESTSEQARRGSWDQYIADCNACEANNTSGLDVCNCPDPKPVADHERLCGDGGCTDDYYSNVSDGRLPYEGTYGASGPFFNGGVPQNWWHFGEPKSGQIVSLAPGEPSFSLLDSDSKLSSPTTHLEVGFGAAYTYKIVSLNFDLTADFDFRGGLALRESQTADPDAHPAVRDRVSTWVDAEGRAQIKASAHIDVDLPILGHKTLLNETFDIMKPKSARSNSAAARYSTMVEYSDEEPTSFTDYKVGGAEADLDSCLYADPTSKPPVEVMSGYDVTKTIDESSAGKLVPCNIKICDLTTFTLESCDFDANNQLYCVPSDTVCQCGDTSMQMCDDVGNTYDGSPAGATDCDQVNDCHGDDVCATQADCTDGSYCSGGCCQFVK